MPASPPYNLTMGSTVTANVSGGQDYFYLLLSGGNVTTFSFTNSDQQSAETVIVVFQQDGTGSRTVGWATNIVNTPTIYATANKYTIVKFTYDVQSQLWFADSATANHN
jgi:hypothetical protein